MQHGREMDRCIVPCGLGFLLSILLLLLVTARFDTNDAFPTNEQPYAVTVIASQARSVRQYFQVLFPHRQSLFVLDATNATDLNLSTLQARGMVVSPWVNATNVLWSVYGILPPTAMVTACLQSHRRALERALAVSSVATLILEDDAQPLTSHYENDIAEILRTLPPHWDFVQLGKCWDIYCHRRQFTPFRKRLLYEPSMGYELCTHSYLVSQEGAQRVLQYTFPTILPIDHLIMVLCRQKLLTCFVSTRNIFQQRSELTSLLNEETPPGTPPCNKNGTAYAKDVGPLFPVYDPDVVATILGNHGDA